MIDIIIPIYNVDLKQLKTCLSSIVAQSIVDNIKVTIVDDASYSIDKISLHNLLDQMKIFLDIQYLRYEENHGPGYARQYGINNTDNEYIMFADADDMLSPIAAEALLEALNKSPDKAIAVGEFYSLRTRGMEVKIIGTQLTWVFAKMYRRSVIEEYELSFNTNKSCSYGNEDVGFNVQFQHIFGDECLVFVKYPLYYWSDINKTKSMTRKNHGEYSYNNGHKGYIMNFIYSFIKTKDKAIRKNSEEYAYKHLFDIYNDMHKRLDDIRKYGSEEDLMQYAYLYYNEVFREFDTIYNEELIKKYYERFCTQKDRGYDYFIEYLNKLRNNTIENK